MSNYIAERYPLPMECPECGMTMRPVHKHRVPDMPRFYFCTFCDAMISEDHPDIRFRKKPTNGDAIRAMSDEELARFIDDVLKYNIVAEPDSDICSECKECDCAPCWLDWLKSAQTE